MPAAETELTDDLVERVRNLSPAAKDRLRDLLDPDEVWTEELTRRAERVVAGTAVLLTPEEVEVRVRAALSEEGVEL